MMEMVMHNCEEKVKTAVEMGLMQVLHTSWQRVISQLLAPPTHALPD